MVAPVEAKPRVKGFDPTVAGPLAEQMVKGPKDRFRGLTDGAKLLPKRVVDGVIGVPLSEFVDTEGHLAAQVSGEVLEGLAHGGPTLTKRGVRL